MPISNTQNKARQYAENSSSTKMGTLKFPPDYEKESGGHWFTLTEYEYSRPSMGSDFKPVATGTQIALPIPINLAPSYGARWGEDNQGAWMNYISKAGVNLFEGAKNSANYEMSISNLQEKWDGMKTGSSDALSAVGTDILYRNSIATGIGTVTGEARNPFLAANFEGVQFRRFSFDYDLIPKTRQDSNTIENIIKSIKLGMHPSYKEFGTMKNALFRYPNMFLPAFSKPAYLFDFGFSVITNFTVQYHSAQGPYYHSDGNDKLPAFININFELQEIEIVTKETLGSHRNSVGGSARGR
jgi:hypothetical protein